MQAIHILSRAVIISEGHLLLARFLKKDGTETCFLPGGHVEYNESIEAALRRELDEELAISDVGSVQLLSLYEYSWDQDSAPYHEINFLLSCNPPTLNYPETPISAIPHLRFLWQSLEKLHEVNFLPADFRTLIPKLLKERPILGDQWRVNLGARQSLVAR